MLTMFYALIFDFGMGTLVVATCGFFVWCCFAFTEDRKHHPIYRDTVTIRTVAAEPGQEERNCA